MGKIVSDWHLTFIFIYAPTPVANMAVDAPFTWPEYLAFEHARNEDDPDVRPHVYCHDILEILHRSIEATGDAGEIGGNAARNIIQSYRNSWIAEDRILQIRDHRGVDMVILVLVEYCLNLAACFDFPSPQHEMMLSIIVKVREQGRQASITSVRP